MPVKIHHGPPGAYKTSGAVIDDFVPWAEEGRVIVTNVRGLEDTDDFIINYQKVFGDKGKTIPESFEIIYLDTEQTKERKRMQEWFMWAPEGCAFLIDEIQTIYPQKMTAAEYKELGFKSLEAAKKEGKPQDVYIAFEKHRHYNWDFVVTAPSIKKVPAIVKDISEVAFYHQNKGKIGLKGRYLEAMHHPDDSGRLETQWIAHSIKKASKKSFGLYGSTATGLAKDTEVGMNIFMQPKVLAVAGLLVVATGWLISQGNPLSLGPDEVVLDDVAETDAQGELISADDNNAIVETVSAVDSERALLLAKRKAEKQRIRERNKSPLEEHHITIGGEIFERFVVVQSESSVADLTESELIKLGYRIEPITDCLWKLRHISDERMIDCTRQQEDKPQRAIRPSERVQEMFGTQPIADAN